MLFRSVWVWRVSVVCRGSVVCRVSVGVVLLSASLPLFSSFGPRCPTAAVLGYDVDVGIVALVLCLQAGQVGWRGHASADSNFAQTLEPMSGSHCGREGGWRFTGLSRVTGELQLPLGQKQALGQRKHGFSLP